MRKIDDSERPMPEIDLAKVCFIIEKSREYLGEDVGVEADDSNPADDEEHIMLTDAAGLSLRRELIEFIKDLEVDEAAAVVALAWIGRDDFQPEEWKIAVAEAKERAEGPTWKYLMEMSSCRIISRTRSPPSAVPARASDPRTRGDGSG
jgi:Protein of unknown function (DUF3775)